MTNFSTVAVRTLTVLLIVTALVFSTLLLPGLFNSTAETRSGSEPAEAEKGLPNFDIRTQNNGEAKAALAGFRGALGRNTGSVDMIRAKIAEGEVALRTRMPDVVVEYNDRLGAAEVISPNVWKDDPQYLTSPGGGERPEALKNFLKDNTSLVGLDRGQTDSLKVAADYTNPDGNLSYTH